MSATHIKPVLPRSGQSALLGCALVSTVLWLSVATVARAQQGIEQELRATLSALPHPEVRVGAYVVDLDTGRPVFIQNADIPLIPASSMKVFVMAAALAEFGPGFSFETLFATNGTDLVVIGDGDPAPGDEKVHHTRDEPITSDFERWADTLLEKGISTIPGDLVIDESIFDDQWIHPSWEENDLDNWYAAPVGGLNFNGNCIDITVSPTVKHDAPVLVSVQPETRLVKIINRCRSGGKGTPILHHPHDTFEYRITGRCDKRWPFGSVSFPDPGLLFADSLRTVLAKKGIRLDGGVRRERVRLPGGGLPASLTIIGRRTTPLVDVLRRIGKDSQNLFAECLLKRTGCAWAKRHGNTDPQGSWALGREAVWGLIERAGIDARGLIVADGSGLSRDNRCTARQMAELLARMHAQPEGGLLHKSLSVAGVDGSLRKRLTDIPGRVRAKTGTMRGVRALTGYVGPTFQSASYVGPTFQSVKGGTGAGYAFAVLFNGYKGPSTPYKECQDRFCRILAASRR
ncbi:MAG: D-alanyl-D-alanine carboxypeptidase/D-alanyl-D-alanine-endopeptidase [Phycisphaerae bacterium]